MTTLLPKVRSALFEVATREPAELRLWTVRAVIALFALLLIWACVAKLDIVSVAQGKLVPETYVKIVQPTDAGIVREILVKDGDQVTAGQVLIRLDPTESGADSLANTQTLDLERLHVRRLEAELADKPLVRLSGEDPLLFAQVDAQHRAHRRAVEDTLSQAAAARDRASKELAAEVEELRKLQKTAPMLRRSADAYAKLANENLVGKLEAEDRLRLATEREQDMESQRATVDSLKASVLEADRHLAQIRSGSVSELQIALVEAGAKVAQLEQADVKLHYRSRNLELKAPQAGVVKDLATTTVGAVVQPGTVLLNLVPVGEQLRAEVSIENEDIGFVRPGQTVRLKLATYPFQRYGMLEGLVRTVSADASIEKQDAQGSGHLPGYKAVVSLSEQALDLNGLKHPIAAGMQLTAEIVEGERTVLEYLLSPVRRVTSEAGMER
ncbi:MAG: HlyD family type I secretion periplasmic adaptor subunit [Pseudomonadota bacterium]